MIFTVKLKQALSTLIKKYSNCLNNKITYLLFFFAALLLVSCTANDNIPSLRESYSKNDSKPFGANIAYRQLEAMFTDNIIRDKRQPFTSTWQGINDTGSLYICVASKLFVNEEEVNAMLEYVQDGNDLVISAGRVDENLLKQIKCDEMYADITEENMLEKMQDTKAGTFSKPETYYGYYYFPIQNHFINIDSSTTKVLGFNNDGKPNSIVYFHGAGRLFLQCEPRALSNYFLLTHDNHQYLQQVLAYTGNAPEHVYWDDYYSKLSYRKKGKNDNGFSTLSEIMKHPPLVYAFWLALLLMLLYILFGGKRVQRIIEQLKPNENTTLTFTETIGRLYLQKKDNKNIADKMVTYFNEYIRNTYFLNSNHVNDDFVTVLSRKSGVEKEKVDTLYRSIAATQSSDVVNDYQLLSLQQQIQDFYKNKG